MLNHFATLLGNIKAKVPADDTVVLLAAGSEELLAITDDPPVIALYEYVNAESTKVYDHIINRDYQQIALPTQLQRFYDVLFPDNVSDYRKQLLLYYYLRVVAASDHAADILGYDSRVSYNLDELTNYFRASQTVITLQNDASTSLLVSGEVKFSEDMNDSINMFIIKQPAATRNVLIYSATQNKYYKKGETASSRSEGMEIPIVYVSPRETAPISVGDSSLTCVLAGDVFTPPQPGTDRIWAFSARAKINIDFNQILSNIKNNFSIVADMLDYAKEDCNTTYENMWLMHYNDTYRLAGLLLAYVERVNHVWQKLAT